MSSELITTGLVVGSFYALIGLGFTVFYGTVRLINFAHGDVYMIGAFIGFTVISALGPGFNALTGAAAAIFATILVSGVLGLAMRFIYANVQSRRTHFSPLIAAIGLSIVLQNSALHIWGSAPQVYPTVLPSGNIKTVVALGVAALVFLSTELWVGKTRFGAAMRAVGIDHGAVRLDGDPGRTRHSDYIFCFLGSRRNNRSTCRLLLRLHRLLDGLYPWHQRIYRCGSGRCRQCSWRPGGWARAGHSRDIWWAIPWYRME